MSQLSDKEQKTDWIQKFEAVAPLFEQVRPNAIWATRDHVHQTAKKILKNLPQDIKALEQNADFLFLPVDEDLDLNQKTVDLLRGWHQDQPPSLTALCAFALDHLNLDLSPALEKAILVASVLGDVENTLPYHNNLHYKKVMLQMVRLICAHRIIYGDRPEILPSHQMGLLLLIPSIHDLGHDGKGNTVRGVFEAGRLERRAFDLSLPYLEKCDLDARDLDALRVMLLCTDVSPLGDPASPVNQMKAAYRYHFMGQKKRMGPLNLDDDLSPLEEDPVLTMMAVLLHEADIATSSGLDYSVTSFETSLYNAEMGEQQARPEDVVDFINDICQRQMLSEAAKELYSNNMAAILAKAEKEIQSGNLPFPPNEQSDFLRGRAEEFMT